MHLYRRMLIAIAVVAGVAVAQPAAAPASGSGDRDRSRPSHVLAPISAVEFLTRAAAANQFEIVTGQLAQQRARSSEVRMFGAELVRDHTALLQQGSAVAARLGIAVQPALTPDQRRTVAFLQRLSGRAFDRAFLRVQLRAHEEALRLHLRGALRGDRPEIRALALGGLPVVVRHYAHVLDLLGAGSTGRHGHHWGPGRN